MDRLFVAAAVAVSTVPDCAGGTVLDDDAANGASLRSSSQNDISTKTAEDEDSK